MRVERLLASVLPVLAALGLAGCIKQKVLVVVEPDGSGNIVVTRALAGEGGSQMARQFRGGGRFGDSGGGEESIFREKLFKVEARLYGKGVTFVKAERTKVGSSEGAVAVYAFKDVNQVRVPLDVQMQALMSGVSAADMDELDEADLDEMPSDLDMPNTVTFSFDKANASTLRIAMPASVEDVKPEKEEAGGGHVTKEQAAVAEVSDEGEEDEEFFGMSQMQVAQDAMKTMYRGARFTVAVECRGTVTKCNATHRLPAAPRRLVLLDLDFDRMLSSPKFATDPERMQMMFGHSDSGLAELMSLPGAVVETNRHVEVVFN